MIIAISEDKDEVSMHFGRCEKYILFNIKNKKIINKTKVPNSGHEPFFLPKFLEEKGVDVLVTSGIGPRAINLFNELNINVISNVEGRVEDIIKEYLEGKINEKLEPCEEHKNMI